MVPVFTNGFDSPQERSDHFRSHQHEFPHFADEEDYEDAADAFLGGACPAEARECVRANGRRVRFCPATDEFGVLAPGNIIVTYFIPDPFIHRKGTNLAYFLSRC